MPLRKMVSSKPTPPIVSVKLAGALRLSVAPAPLKLTEAPALSVPLMVAFAPASICNAPVSVSAPARVTEPASSIVTGLPTAPAVRVVRVAAPVTFRVPAPLTAPVSRRSRRRPE